MNVSISLFPLIKVVTSTKYLVFQVLKLNNTMEKNDATNKIENIFLLCPINLHTTHYQGGVSYKLEGAFIKG